MTTCATAPPACSPAMDVASGSVIAQHYRRHRHQEFLRFLKLIDAAVPDGLDLHLLCDNYATHKTPEVRNWLLRHPRFHLHRVSRGPANALLTTSVEACGWYWTSDSACTTYGPVSRTVVNPPGPPKPPERRAGPCPVGPGTACGGQISTNHPSEAEGSPGAGTRCVDRSASIALQDQRGSGSWRRASSQTITDRP